MNNQKKAIKVIKDGPYLVTGSIPIEEKIISEKENRLEYKQGRQLPQSERYSLCRCGRSKNMPFCDGAHSKEHFKGDETASKEPYLQRAKRIEGPDLVLTDAEQLCAFARFCHEEHGDVWGLTEGSDDPRLKEEAISAACNCPAGRLVAWDKNTGEPIEPSYEPSIVIIQDPLKNCSGPIWVRGGIEIEAVDGSVYETRNRVTLCRCGKSENKPFCDATHASIGFVENK